MCVHTRVCMCEILHAWVAIHRNMAVVKPPGEDSGNFECHRLERLLGV